MSTSGQPQFRYTQTPSKVLHLRNLPWECIEEELVELCKPFGKIVNTKCNVGANRNQAFVEFVDLNQAINMVSYYASSSEPAQIRGKTVYIQYSNRHEIVNNKSPGDVPGNVLLVTIEGVEAGDVSIDVIHLALIQYSDVQTAATARDSLDGRSIPRYLLPSHVNECHLRISYSAHTDLNIKFQSHRSRDYTNPYLPVNPTAMEGFVQPAVGPDGKKKEFESNVLLASIENMQYTVTVDVLHTVMNCCAYYSLIVICTFSEKCIHAIGVAFDQVFSAFGTVQKIAIFEKNGGTQALIQYPDIATAGAAKEALEGHCIYDGGYCKLHLSYSRHTDLNVKAYSDKSRDYTIPLSLAMQQTPGVPGVGYASGSVGPGQASMTQVSSWDPAAPAGRPNFVSVPSTFPGQAYASASRPSYAAAPVPPFGSPGFPQMRGAQPMQPSNMPPYYGS
ncbi:hypothetical protein DH2020_036970 [Rehmannia glutinosa]|uniref:RRM domain-containing protein n=1 Tax=Rehmannia glutinosa TaxID=99300 RepID=A0ABR0V2V9_REHGL